MKTMQNLLLAVALTCSGVLLANTEPTEDTKPATISQEVGRLLDKHNLKLDNEVKTQVTFTVNKENEIVVLEVDTNDKQIENFVKARLNYKKLKNTSAEAGKNYFLPVKVEKS